MNFMVELGENLYDYIFGGRSHGFCRMVRWKCKSCACTPGKEKAKCRPFYMDNNIMTPTPEPSL